jgi:hypothetical protein
MDASLRARSAEAKEVSPKAWGPAQDEIVRTLEQKLRRQPTHPAS